MPTDKIPVLTVIRRAMGSWSIACPYCGATHWHPRKGEHESRCGKGRYEIADVIGTQGLEPNEGKTLRNPHPQKKR